MVGTTPRLSTAPVLAVLVCHDGEARLAEVLAALRALTVRPRHLLAVDTGSSDGTAELLAAADDLLDGVLTRSADTGFGAAVSAALEHAVSRWGDPGRWLWLVHDDSAPEPDCLANLLGVADLDSAAAVLGPLGLDWDDPRLVVDAGLSADASGHRQTGIAASELDPALDAPHRVAVEGAQSTGGIGDSTSERSGPAESEVDATGAVEAPVGEKRRSEQALSGNGSGAGPGDTTAESTSDGDGSAWDGTGAGAAEDGAEAARGGVDSVTGGAASGEGVSGEAVTGGAAADQADGAAAGDGGDRSDGSDDTAAADPAGGQDGSDDAGAADRRTEGAHSGMLVSEVLAVSTAGALVRRDVFEHLGGFDEALPLGFDDIDFGWRANSDGHLVLCVPSARMRHAGALRKGERTPDASAQRTPRAAERVGGVRTFLVNASLWSFVLGVPRLLVLALLRATGYALLRRWRDASAELAVVSSLCTGRMGVRTARASRRVVTPRRSAVRGLLTSRLARMRNGLRAAFAGLVRERVRREVVLGRAALSSATITSVPSAAPRPVGPDALPTGALGEPGARQRRVAGLRRLAGPVVVPVETLPAEQPQPRPSPVPRGSAPEPAAPDRELLLVRVDRWRVLRELVLAPPVVLTIALIALALLTHGLAAEHPRFGGELTGGRLLPAASLGATWHDYVASWHPVNGGTGSPAPASLLVLALLGSVLAPIGGPSAVLAVLLLFGVPLAGLSAYASTRVLRLSGTQRALAAGVYALLPAATWSAGQGRVDVVVAHVLVPPLLAGLSAVLGLSRLATMARSRHWLSTACLTALGLAALGAFAPLVHLLLVVLALVGFVAVPSEARRAPRRVAGLAALVLLPVACLLPWPVVLLEHPEMLVHGLGARFAEAPAGGWLAALSPDGSPASWAGGLLVLAAVLSLALAARRAMIPGAVTALLGWAAAVAVDRTSVVPIGGGPVTTGATGPPLVVAAAGLLWMVLSAGRIRYLPQRVTAAFVAAAVLATGVSAVFAGRGPLRTEPVGATPALISELAEPGSLLVLNRGPQPARLVEDHRPHFGDDDLVPVGTAVDWLRQAEADVLSGDPHRVRSALAAAAARGAGHVALPDAASAAGVQAAAGDLVADHGRLSDGSVVLRVLLPTSPVELLGPDLARRARLEATPSPQVHPLPVPATSPQVAVRVSDGGVGRVLVLAAEQEPGWQAVINGREAPLATAWGHQVAVPLPDRASEVRIGYRETSRTSMLIVEAAALLFTAIGALPSRRRTPR